MKKNLQLILLLMCFSVSAFAQTELVSTGAANAYAVVFPGAFSYSNGITITFKANFSNTGAATLNINSLGAKTIVKQTSATLAANDILIGMEVIVTYDGTNFQMTSASGNTATVTGITGTGTQNFLPKFNNAGGTTLGNSLIFDNGTNVGIGVTAPSSTFEINKSVSVTSGTLDGSKGAFLSITNSEGSIGTMAGIRFKSSSDAGDVTYKSSLFFQSTQSNGRGDLIIAMESSGGTSTVSTTGEAMRITKDRNIGIGTNSPSSLLHVNGDLRLGRATSTNGVIIFNNSTNANTINFKSGVTSTSYVLTLPTAVATAANSALVSDAGGILSWVAPGTLGAVVPSGLAGQTIYSNAGIWTATSNLYNDGTNVGIGSIAPAAKLDVIGTVKITDGTQSLNKVLTSDANGLASWQNAPVSTNTGFSAYSSAGLALTTGSTNLVICNVIEYDDGGNYVPGAFRAPATGVYQFNANVMWLPFSALSNGATTIILKVNGTDTKYQTTATNTNFSFSNHISTALKLNAGDVVTVFVRYAGSALSSGSIDVSSPTNTWFNGYRIY